MTSKEVRIILAQSSVFLQQLSVAVLMLKNLPIKLPTQR